MFFCHDEENSKIKKYSIYILFVFLFVLVTIFYNLIYPFNFHEEGVSKIAIVLQVSSKPVSVCADAEIMGEENIKEAIDVLNNIKIIPEKCSVYDLEGESPSAWILFYDGKKEVDHINIYYDIIKYDDKYYRISVSEYDELIELCKRYG